MKIQRVLQRFLPLLIVAPATFAAESTDWWSEVQRSIAASEYEISHPGTWQAPNRAQGFRTFFDDAGIRVVSRTEPESTWEWRLTWVAYGRGGASWPVDAADLDAKGAHIEYHRGSLREWYDNSPRGLKQGFVLAAPPEEVGRTTGVEAERVGTVSPGRGRRIDPERLIHVDLALGGSLRPAFAADGLAIDFEAPGGARVIRYAELLVTDARGETLAAWMEGYVGAGGGGIRIVIDDTGATYPITIDPLATFPAWTVHGGQAGACLGISVATAGDVDGDGYSDVIVGAYGYDNGEAEEGAAFLYRGSPSGPASSASWSAEGNQASAYFGVSVATAGDTNGDGYSDVIIGTYLFDNGQTNEGRAFVYLGSASGLAATPVWTAEADQANAYFGYRVATAGDVNGDGYSDVVVGAFLFDAGETDEGRAFVYHGSPSGPSTAPDWMAESNQATAYFGESVATAGDVNGDGYADLVVGGRLSSTGGRAFVYSGGPGGLGPSASWTAEGGQGGANFGRAAGTAGDVNGDGFADIIVGAPGYDNGQTDEGRAFVYHGSPTGPSAVADWTVESDQVSANLGRSVATAGDVNGDGYADVIIGAHLFDNGQVEEGRAFVYLGSASGLLPVPDWTAESDQSNSWFGYSAATAGDVNGDGFSDVIVGAYQFDGAWSNEGRASVFLGAPDGLAANAGWTTSGLYALGHAVGSAGDVNGDGYADVIVGVPHYDNGEASAGRVLVYHGSAAGLELTPAWTAEGSHSDEFGSAAGTAGDVNGDGYSDVIVGAPGAEESILFSEEGRAFVYHGAASGLRATPAWSASGAQEGAHLGHAVGAAGDVNGDGFADVIVGVPNFDAADRGSALVYYGSPAGLAPLAGWASAAWWGSGTQFGRSVGTAGDVNGDGYADIIVGSRLDMALVYEGSPSGLATSEGWAGYGAPDESFGHAVGSAGDVNGDGFSDVIVGAPDYPNYLSFGRAAVFLGSPSGLAENAAWGTGGDVPDARFGEAVATAGDVNGDGYSDVVVGAPGRDANGEVGSGRALVFHGSASGLATSPAWTSDGDHAGARLGDSVATAGDVNGDGYADVVVGAPTIAPFSDEGHAYVYYGNGGPGLALLPRQLQDDLATPIALLGKSERSGGFRLSLTGRSPSGRGKVGVDWEVKPLGVLFDGEGLESVPPENDTGIGGVTLDWNFSGLEPGRSFHWRARLVHDPVTHPFQRRGRWITMPWNGWQEADLRTDWQADLSVSQTDSPDPQFEGRPIDYTVVVSNGGPAAASAILTDTLPAGSTFLGATPSQGTCSHASGVVTCDLGEIGVDSTAEVVIQVSAPDGWGTATNVATVAVAAPAADPDPSNDSSSESTQTRALNIGDHVWRDLDRDGVQDEGEPGLPDVVVLLYNGAGQLLDAAATNHNGYYVFFEGLHYGTLYNLRFVPPLGFEISPPDQGPDDAADSDADPVTGDTPVFSLTEFSDATGWDAGMHDCWAPDEAVWLYEVGVTADGNEYPILNFQDPNQPDQVTGYNIYRSDTPGAAWPWPLVASDVVDMDEGTPNKQWVDTSGDVPPSGIWYYQVTATNHRCPAEGPR